MLSFDLLCKVNDFKVKDFNPLYSDKHNAIEFSLGMNYVDKKEANNIINETGKNLTPTEPLPKWDSSKQDEFIENMNAIIEQLSHEGSNDVEKESKELKDVLTNVLKVHLG